MNNYQIQNINFKLNNLVDRCKCRQSDGNRHSQMFRDASKMYPNTFGHLSDTFGRENKVSFICLFGNNTISLQRKGEDMQHTSLL